MSKRNSPSEDSGELQPPRGKELLQSGVLAALFGWFLFYCLSEWEQDGSTREFNAILYGLYMLLGKRGAAALLWIAPDVMIWKGVGSRT